MKRCALSKRGSSSGPGVFTLILRVKIKLFTVNIFGGAKLFTVGCGEWFLRLSLPPMNNFGATIRDAGQKGWTGGWRNRSAELHSAFPQESR